MYECHCDYALLPQGWAQDVRLRVGADGRLAAVDVGVARGTLPSAGRYVIPGMPNLHSHAFQRAMAGSAERFGRADDSFWTWREAMYAHAGRVSPDTLHAIARWLYVEMLEAGYTRVCEFHYVHHQADGRPYAAAGAMCEALRAAAQEAGIGLTLLPTLYQRGGFADQPLSARQRRFAQSTEDFLRLLQSLDGATDLRLGAAIHSLRAVAEAPLQQVVGDPLLRARPIHIHIAEQQLEVEDCLRVHGQRPVERLYALTQVDARYCLVHATHVTPAEIEQMARSQAVVGICTTTEANLGDGLFPLTALRAAGGRWGIGSDSHIGLDPREELRWLEYQARLGTGRRTVLADAAQPDVAANVWLAAVAGGAQASGAAAAGLVAGADADWLVLDDSHPSLAGASTDTMLATWMFAPCREGLRSVVVGGRERARQGQHPQREQAAADYRRALAQLNAVGGAEH